MATTKGVATYKDQSTWDAPVDGEIGGRIAAKPHRTTTLKTGNHSNVTWRNGSCNVRIHLLYVNRTDAIYQFIQRNLLADPHHDQTICRNPFILHARQRCE